MPQPTYESTAAFGGGQVMKIHVHLVCPVLGDKLEVPDFSAVLNTVRGTPLYEDWRQALPESLRQEALRQSTLLWSDRFQKDHAVRRQFDVAWEKIATLIGEGNFQDLMFMGMGRRPKE